MYNETRLYYKNEDVVQHCDSTFPSTTRWCISKHISYLTDAPHLDLNQEFC